MLAGGLLAAAAVLPPVTGLPLVTDAAAQDAAPAKPAAPPKRLTAAQQAKQMKDAKAAAEAQREGAAAGQRAYAAGIKAFEGGDIQGAEQQLSVALSGGGLPNAQMARALYYRGSAYRQLGRPAQAISDLTTAVWLKGGLPDDLKAKAVEARKLAYQEAGLGTSPPPVGAAPLDQSAAAAAPKAVTGTQIVQVTEQGFWSGVSMPSLPSLPTFGGGQPTQTAEAAAPAAPGAQQPSSFWNFLPSFGGGASQPAAEGMPPEAAGFSTTTVAASSEAGSAPAMGFATTAEPAQMAQPTAWDTQTATSAATQPAPSQSVVASLAPPHDAYVPPPAAPAAPAAAAPDASAGTSNPLAGAGQAVTGFFSNMFGSSSGTQPAPAADAVTTGSTEAQPGGWSGDTSVVTSQTSSMVQRGPESPPSSAGADASSWTTQSQGAAAKPAPQKVANAAPTAAAGNYKLQVAAVRSREEAQSLAQSLSTYPAVQNGTVRTEIDEAVIGSMGTFYRVRLGPYADAKEPGQLCATLRPQGFDCLVVTQ